MARAPRKTTVSQAISKSTNHVDVAREYAKNKKLEQEVINPPRLRAFSGRDFSKQDMSEMYPLKEIKHGDFSDCNLDGADFRGFNLQGCVFKGASLNGTLFQGADLRWANFHDCDMEKIVLFDVNDDGIPTNMADTHEVDGMTR